MTTNSGRREKMNATKKGHPLPAAITDPKIPPNAFKIKISFSLDHNNALVGEISARKSGDGSNREIRFGDLFKLPPFRQSLFAIDSEIERSESGTNGKQSWSNSLVFSK